MVSIDAAIELRGGEVTGSLDSGPRGGGVGILSWNLEQAVSPGVPVLEVVGTRFADHPGPAIYLNGPGETVLDGVLIEEVAWGGGVLPVPGAVVALFGEVPPVPESAGLRLNDTFFRDAQTHGLLLHASSAQLEAVTFEGVEGYEVFLQACDGIEEPLTGTAGTNDCAGPAEVVEPVLWWSPTLSNWEVR
jgi:hypothetical protein